MPSNPAQPAPVLLSVGYDLSLLLTRNELLRSGGFTVVPAINRHQAILAAANQPVVAAILCHSISAQDAANLAHDLDIVRPGMTILRLRDYPDLSLREAAVSSELVLQMVRAAVRCRAT
jgi:hypothetical protein